MGRPSLPLFCLSPLLHPVSLLKPGGSTPPGITAPAVPSIPSPIGVNGFTGLPPQANGQPAAEAVFANGIHPYPGKHIWYPFLLHAACSSSFPVSALTVITGMCGSFPLSVLWWNPKCDQGEILPSFRELLMGEKTDPWMFVGLMGEKKKTFWGSLRGEKRIDELSNQVERGCYTATSLQSCPTLCDPIDSSPPGSPAPGILKARTLEWVAISFSNA